MDFKSLPLPDTITGIARTVQRHGGRTFLVGGPVRDLLLNRSAPDWDIAIDLQDYQNRARLEKKIRQLLHQLCQKFGGKFVFHPRFLTAAVTLPDQRIDICHTREETYPAPAVLPRVQPAPIERDLFRRDFTINALALELTPQGTRGVIDPYDGQKDLKLRLVRIIHPRSFIDDPTRIFRAIRFAVRLNYEIESGTLYLMRDCIKQGYPARLTPERILYEIRCILKEPAALKMLEALFKEGVLESTWQWHPAPELPSRLQILKNHGADPEDLFCYLLASFPVTEKFPITREERDTRETLINFHPIKHRLQRAQRPSTIYFLLKNLPERALRIIALLEPDSATGKKINLYLTTLKNCSPLVTAPDLIQLGVKPGKKLGALLQQIFARQLDRSAMHRECQRQRDELLLFARRLVRQNAPKVSAQKER